MNSKIKILHLEDMPTDAELVKYELNKSNLQFEMKVVDNEEEYEEMLSTFHPDIILSDHSLTSFDSSMALSLLKEKDLDIPFILVTATISEEFAVDIMKRGADDYILKDRLQRLPSAVTNSIQKRRMEEEQRAATERLRFHIENTPLGFIEWDDRGFVTSWSHRMEEIFGWKNEPGRGRNIFNKVYEKDLPWVSKILQELASGKVERNKVLYRNITERGAVIWCEWFNSVLKDKNGKVTTIMSMVQDISEQKELERQKDNFLTMTSHELKTPVTTIKAYGQLAEGMLEDKGDIETSAMIKRLNSSVNKLTGLIENLLDFDRIQKGMLVYKEEFFDFNEMVKEVIDDMQKTSPLHEIKNNAGEPAEIFGDKDKLGQVLINLISNAVKYSPKANNIIVSTGLQKDGVELTVQDFGIGISAENKEHIFQQFYRITGENPSTYPGMGIGLYICSEIVRRQGGKIWVESVPGDGSVFHTWLPFDHRKYQPANATNDHS